MKLPLLVNVRPRVLFDIIYQNPVILWKFSEAMGGNFIFMKDESEQVYFLTIYSEHIYKRLISLTKKFNNLKLEQNGTEQISYARRIAIPSTSSISDITFYK